MRNSLGKMAFLWNFCAFRVSEGGGRVRAPGLGVFPKKSGKGDPKTTRGEKNWEWEQIPGF